MLFLYFFAFIFKAHSYLVCASVFDETSYVDNYKSFHDLTLENEVEVDYRIVTQNNSSEILVIAPHGGTIESGTSQVARAIAGHDLNLYLFEGVNGKGFDLHITSVNFDEPQALRMVQNSQVAVSVHAFNSKRDCICIGGINKELAERISSGLKKAGFTIEFPCEIFKGESPKNIVNKAKQGGIQLEVSSPLMQRLLESESLLQLFVEAVRAPL